MKVEKNMKVKIHYTGSFEDGTVFDSSEGKAPLEFVTGHHMVVPGFEEAIMGMEKGEEKTFTLPPEKAYGQHNPQLVQKIPREHLPPQIEPKVGIQLALKAPNGQVIPATITGMDDATITLDLNPPLAGKTLTFKVKVESFEPLSEEEMKKEGGCCGGVCKEESDSCCHK